MLKGKVALVTGASRGIGAATAKLLARNGAIVGVNYLKNEDAAKEVVNEIRGWGGYAMAIKADVTDKEQVDMMVSNLCSEFGPIEILVANANIDFPVKPILKLDFNDFEAKIIKELEAVFYLVKAVSPYMIENNSGAICAVTSDLSRRPAHGYSTHSVAKATLDSFVKCLALELGPYGIRVNAVAPGLTETDATSFMPSVAKKNTADQTPLRRIAVPDDIAGAILMLSSDAARFITGAYIAVDGGRIML